MRTISDAEFTDAMRAAVLERGSDFVYPQQSDEQLYEDDEWHDRGACMYSKEDGTAACLLGLAISTIDPALLPAWGTPENTDNGQLWLESVGVSRRAARAAGVAQNRQDMGRTWGEALLAYEAFMEAPER